MVRGEALPVVDQSQDNDDANNRTGDDYYHNRHYC